MTNSETVRDWNESFVEQDIVSARLFLRGDGVYVLESIRSLLKNSLSLLMILARDLSVILQT